MSEPTRVSMALGSNGYPYPNAKVSPTHLDRTFVSRKFLSCSSVHFHLEVKYHPRNFAERYRKCVSLEESPQTAAQRLSVGRY
jgi:hypothetical protein